MRRSLFLFGTIALLLGIPRGSGAAFFLNFEEGFGHDGVAIGTFYSGITFTRSDGQEWLFGDSNSNRYNTHSVDLGIGWNEDAYNHYGYVFTWTGVIGYWGRIDFNNQDGTYFQVRYCAATELTLEAYDSNDSLIDSVTGPANLRPGALDMDTLRVEAPSGSHIAWVKIHDTGNMWLVDNIEGGFSGVVINPDCSNGVDDDGDGCVDYGTDCGCTGSQDDSEAEIYCCEGGDGGGGTIRPKPFCEPETGLHRVSDSEGTAQGLRGIYPNPFNPDVSISYALTAEAFVTLRVYDAAGHLVITLVNENKGVGEHIATWEARGYPSGIYFCRLHIGGVSETRKLVLLK